MAYRDTASFGKRQEHSVIAQLLRRGFDVYTTLVDDQGIDCVVRLSPTKYIEVQIKARSEIAKQWSTFAALSFAPRGNYYFIFYLEKNDSFWVVPSRRLASLGHTNKSGKNKRKVTVVFPKRLDGLKFKRFEKFHGENGFRLLPKQRAV